MSQTDDLSTELDLLPTPVALELLAEQVRKLAILRGSQLRPMTESDRHLVEFGHRLAFGCCRTVD